MKACSGNDATADSHLRDGHRRTCGSFWRCQQHVVALNQDAKPSAVASRSLNKQGTVFKFRLCLSHAGLVCQLFCPPHWTAGWPPAPPNSRLLQQVLRAEHPYYPTDMRPVFWGNQPVDREYHDTRYTLVGSPNAAGCVQPGWRSQEGCPGVASSFLANSYNVTGPKYVAWWCTQTIIIILTYVLTYSMEQSPSWEANWFCS